MLWKFCNLLSTTPNQQDNSIHPTSGSVAIYVFRTFTVYTGYLLSDFTVLPSGKKHSRYAVVKTAVIPNRLSLSFVGSRLHISIETRSVIPNYSLLLFIRSLTRVVPNLQFLTIIHLVFSELNSPLLLFFFSLFVPPLPSNIDCRRKRRNASSTSSSSSSSNHVGKKVRQCQVVLLPVPLKLRWIPSQCR